MAEKEKLMLVTTGTSLFESASWGEEDWIQEKGIEAYREWLKRGSLNEPGPLISHIKRIRHEKADEIISFFESELNVNNTDDWAQYFAKDIVPKPGTLRYSAELSTIFDFAMKKAQDWRKFLNDYHIQFIADEDEKSLSRVAAEHNLKYLRSIPELDLSDVRVEPIFGLSSTVSDELEEAVNSLQDYFLDVASKEKHKEVVIIISGGYKIYPLAFASIFCNNKNNKIKIIYRYEEINQVLEMIPEHISSYDNNIDKSEISQKSGTRISIADKY